MWAEGPTRSTCRCEKRRLGTSMGSTSATTWTVVLPWAQSWQSLHQAAISDAMPGQTKRLANICLEARTPGCAMECTANNTAWRQGAATNGLTAPLETLHSKGTPSTSKVRIAREGEDKAA